MGHSHYHLRYFPFLSILFSKLESYSHSRGNWESHSHSYLYFKVLKKNTALMLSSPLVKDIDTVLNGPTSQVHEYLYCVICRFCATALMLTSCLIMCIIYKARYHSMINDSCLGCVMLYSRPSFFPGQLSLASLRGR